MESRSYKKSYLSPEAYCFSKIDVGKPFLVVRILASPSVLLDSYLPLSHIVVGSQVPPYNHFALVVLLY
jgi:hypothetical protein